MWKTLLKAAAYVLLCTTAATAQSVVAPNIYTSTLSGTSGLNTFIRDTGNPRTGQLLINASQLGPIGIGDQITGIAFRLYSGNATSFPASTATWGNYTINVGQGVAFGSQSTTFASNFIGASTTVRTGSLVVPAGAYTGGSNPNPNPFGPTITFTTPYTYTGGNLLIEIRHTGSNITNGGTDFLEAVPTTDAQYNTNVWSATATGDTATVGGQNSFTIPQIFFVAVPEPTTIAMTGMAIAGAGIFWLRRKRSSNRLNQLSVSSRVLRSR